MKVLLLLVMCGAAYGQFKPPRQHVPPHYPNSPHRFYAEHGPHKIIASPKPRSYALHPSQAPPPNFRTMNPVYVPYRNPRSEQIHNHHHQPTPQMIASSSNTPILVLKKDHTRPVLSSAVQATKRSEGPIPTITMAMENPQHREREREREQQQLITHSEEEDDHGHRRQQQHEQPEHRAAPPNVTTTTRPSSPPPPPQAQSPPQQQQQREREREQQHPSRNEVIDHHDHDEEIILSEEHPTAPSGPTASAERRMFFESVASNSGLAQQVSGPRPNPSAPSKHAAASSNIQQQHRAPPTPHHHPHHHHNHPHHHPHRHSSNNRRDDDDDEEDERERIVRSNSPYQQGQQFQYPPPQGNFVAGPTRVPVKYQQGVIGLKQQQQQFIGGHPQQQQARKPQRPYKQRIQQAQQPGSEEPLSEELEDEEEAQPDRLTELLGTSKFTCGGKKDGYYADDSLNCEVFHYCQDGGKHSWLCPNGFAFHQIHLICVPPSSDNICKQSSNYHFVNEYLYKPINEKEAQTYNESLKYADRYFPDGYNHGAGDILLPYNNQQQSQEEDDERRPPIHSQLRPQHQQHHQAPPSHNPYAAGPPRAGPAVYNPYAQQAHSPRPQHHPGSLTGGFIPSQQINPRIPVITSPRGGGNPYGLQHQSQSQLHPQTIVPQKPISKSSSSKSPSPTSSSSSSSSSGSNPAVFFTPESINIPLNQRRPIPNPHPSHHPQIFRPSPQLAHAQQQQSSQSSKKHHHHHQHQHHHSNNKRRKFEDYEY